MRIILTISAIIGAAAAAAPVEAQPWSASSGRGGGAHARPSHPGPAPGTWAVRPSRDRHGRPDRRRGRFFGGGLGVDWAYRTADPYGDGFFADGGGEVLMRRGRPYYDYDRSYPYEFAPASRRRVEWEEEPRCTIEQGVRVCRGGR